MRKLVIGLLKKVENMNNENNIYTIGFTKKNAEQFFGLLETNNINLVLDIRLNNTSQLAGFAKYPDIKYFLKRISDIEYIHDQMFSPEDNTLKKYKKSEINWDEYKLEFEDTMNGREITNHIKTNYGKYNNICLLCSESSANQCHRTLVAEKFKKVFQDLTIINL